MQQRVEFKDFVKAFKDMNRYDHFGYAGLIELFDYLTSNDRSDGPGYELDVIALCCEYARGTWQEIADDYGIDVEGLDDEESKIRVIETIESKGVFYREDSEGQIIYGL